MGYEVLCDSTKVPWSPGKLWMWSSRKVPITHPLTMLQLTSWRTHRKKLPTIIIMIWCHMSQTEGRERSKVLILSIEVVFAYICIQELELKQFSESTLYNQSRRWASDSISHIKRMKHSSHLLIVSFLAVPTLYFAYKGRVSESSHYHLLAQQWGIYL